MFENLSAVQLASAMARHAAARHKVIAQNVANADTPGYRARDIKDFTTLVNETFTARATRPDHASASRSSERVFESVIVDLPRAPNGNSVNLEDQALRAVQAQGEHRLAVALYGKAMRLFRLGLGRLN